MNKPDSIEINCSSAVKNILFEALNNFISSEAHDFKKINNLDLLNLNSISDIFDNTDTTTNFIDSSLQCYCHEAINFHYDHIQLKLNVTFDEQRKLMINMLNGVPTHDKHLDTALLKDNVI